MLAYIWGVLTGLPPRAFPPPDWGFGIAQARAAPSKITPQTHRRSKPDDFSLNKSGTIGVVSSPGTTTRKPKSIPGRALNVALGAVLIFVGPALMVAGTQSVDADEELARTGVHAPGIIVDFTDGRKASARNITVEFTSADGGTHRASAAVDHEQHPTVGDVSEVAYREQDPDQAVVLGYESSGQFLQGIGLILTGIFTTLGIILTISGLRKRRREKRET